MMMMMIVIVMIMTITMVMDYDKEQDSYNLLPSSSFSLLRPARRLKPNLEPDECHFVSPNSYGVNCSVSD